MFIILLKFKNLRYKLKNMKKVKTVARRTGIKLVKFVKHDVLS